MDASTITVYSFLFIIQFDKSIVSFYKTVPLVSMEMKSEFIDNAIK